MPAITSDDSQAGMGKPLFQLPANFVSGDRGIDAALSQIRGPLSLISEVGTTARHTVCSCSQDRFDPETCQQASELYQTKVEPAFRLSEAEVRPQRSAGELDRWFIPRLNAWKQKFNPAISLHDRFHSVFALPGDSLHDCVSNAQATTQVEEWIKRASAFSGCESATNDKESTPPPCSDNASAATVNPVTADTLLGTATASTRISAHNQDSLPLAKS